MSSVVRPPFARIITLTLFTFILFSVLVVAEAAEPPPEPQPVESPELPGFHDQTDDVYLAAFEADNDLSDGLNMNAFVPPQSRASAGVMLPFGEAAFKFEVAETGIYEVSYAELENAGMDVTAVNPNTFAMMNRGDSVAYQFIGDNDTDFEAGEAIRFYGESVFDFPRAQRQHLNYNVYWLWANGTPSHIGAIPNATGNPTATSWRSTVTLEEEIHWFSTWSDDWHLFENDADAWFMDRLIKGAEDRITGTYTIDLPHPYPLGSDADMTVEVNSRSHTFVSGEPKQNVVDVFFNNATTPDANDAWWSVRNRNITGNLLSSQLNHGDNDVHVVVTGVTTNTSRSTIYPNRITVEYDREFNADNNELLFFKDSNTDLEFNISGYSETDYQTYLVWDITTPTNPVAIQIENADLNAGVLRIGSDEYTASAVTTTVMTAPTTFIATTADNARTVTHIEGYTARPIEPVDGAEWVAISHRLFVTATESLALHRQDPLYGGLTTHVVDVEDVINQYGYGLPLPDSIRDYLLASLNWTTPPKYVTLVGDSTMNPRQIDCAFGCPSGFNNHEEAYVPTYLSFVDRFQGVIPTDAAIVMLYSPLLGVENDALPDLPLGRIPVKTAQQATDFIAKVVEYEQNQLNPAEWMENILFVSDNLDGGGNFCAESLAVGGELPASFNNTYLCLDDMSATDLRTAMFDEINNAGTTIMNYRGHGGYNNWASYDILTLADTANFTNVGKPFVLLSADCLDGYFALPGNEALSESILEKQNAGTAAHWSSSGLGYGSEHNVLHNNFYTGLFEHGHTAIGDAIQYAKGVYFDSGKHPSELYAFTLQGDPAMQLMRPDYAIDKSTPVAGVEEGGLTDFTLSLTNNNIYPVAGSISDSLPTGYNFVSASSTAGITTTVVGNDVTIELHDQLGYQESVAVTLVAQLDNPYTGSSPIVNSADTLAEFGIDPDLADNSDSQSVAVCATGTIPMLPAITIAESGSDVVLSWALDTNASGFDIHRAIDLPYFDPATPIGSIGGGDTGYIDAGKTGDPAMNHYYLIAAQGCGGMVEASSNRVGEFDFQIVPGTP